MAGARFCTSLGPGIENLSRSCKFPEWCMRAIDMFLLHDCFAWHVVFVCMEDSLHALLGSPFTRMCFSPPSQWGCQILK